MLFHKSLKVGGIDASVRQGLFEADVCEPVWDRFFLDVIRCLGPRMELRE